MRRECGGDVGGSGGQGRDRGSVHGGRSTKWSTAPDDDRAATHASGIVIATSRLRDFDGVVLACPSVGGVPSELTAMLDELERSSMGAFTNTVFGITGGEETGLAGRVVRLGGIVVAEPAGAADPEVRAMRLGARVATLAGWVRHALSHEHEQHTHQDHHEHHEHGPDQAGP